MINYINLGKETVVEELVQESVTDKPRKRPKLRQIQLEKENTENEHVHNSPPSSPTPPSSPLPPPNFRTVKDALSEHNYTSCRCKLGCTCKDAAKVIDDLRKATSSSPSNYETMFKF